jgi:hypothetical protein
VARLPGKTGTCLSASPPEFDAGLGLDESGTDLLEGLAAALPLPFSLKSTDFVFFFFFFWGIPACGPDASIFCSGLAGCSEAREVALSLGGCLPELIALLASPLSLEDCILLCLFGDAVVLFGKGSLTE